MGTASTTPEEAVPGKTGRWSPVVLTYATNLIQLQKQLKGVAMQNFKLRTPRNGTRVVTKDMVDYEGVKTLTYPTTPSIPNLKNPTKQ
jgi:hypothetical protein